MKISLLRYPLFLALTVACVTSLSAQVSGVSYTLSPAANYTFWDSNLGLDDGFLYGGRLGIGFGENVELRGLYMRDLGLKRNFEGLFDQDLTGLGERDVNLVRYGGEVRLNLGRSRLLPFLTLGGGIQSLELDGGMKNEHIYASGGLGITVSIADRFTFKLEGKNTAFNFNPNRNLLTADERDVFGIGEDDLFSERMSNWSIGTGFTIYLGGRRPGQLSEVDQAYANTFTNGFRNLSVIVEPTLSHINFADELAYRDTYLGGASLGLDFGPYVGMRAFYLRNMDDDKINLDYDRMQVYGADFRFRLTNVNTGISPFLTLGGGYISIDDDYIPRPESTAGLESQAFASGGAGASLNITRNFRLVGTYKLLLTTGTDVEDLTNSDQVRSSGQWTAGVNLVFGKKVERPDVMFTSVAENNVLKARMEADLVRQEDLAAQARKNAAATTELRESYEARITDLQSELLAAYAISDSVSIDSLESVIEDTEAVVAELEIREDELAATIVETDDQVATLRNEVNAQGDGSSAPAASSGNFGPAAAPRNTSNANAQPVNRESRLSFTPAEFEGLIEEIFEGLNAGMPMPALAPGQYDMPYETRVNAPQDTARINAMERQLNELRATVEQLSDRQKAAETARTEDKEAIRKEMQESTQSILEEIRAMREEIGNKSNMTDKEREQLKKDAEKAARDARKAAEKLEKEGKKG